MRDHLGYTYSGNISTSASGRQCITWDHANVIDTSFYSGYRPSTAIKTYNKMRFIKTNFTDIAKSGGKFTVIVSLEIWLCTKADEHDYKNVFKSMNHFAEYE